MLDRVFPPEHCSPLYGDVYTLHGSPGLMELRRLERKSKGVRIPADEVPIVSPRIQAGVAALVASLHDTDPDALRNL